MSVSVQASNSNLDQRALSPTALMLLGIGIVVGLIFAWLGRVILMLLFAAIVVAVVLTAVVDWLKATFKMRQAVAFALILFLGIGFITATVWLIGPQVIDQFQNLQTDLPQAFRQFVSTLNGSSWGRWVIVHWSGYSQLSSSVASAVTRIGGIVVSTATVFAGLVLVAILGLYLAAEPGLYFSGIQRAIPQRYRATFHACAASAVRNIRWWILSQMASMTAVGLLVAIGLWALGVPLAGTLGAISALLTFIPNVGPILSAVPAVLLAVAISPTKGLLTVTLFLLVHFLEGNAITPLLERRIVRLPPALVMSAQLFLAVIAGPLGLALAAPFTAAFLGVFDVLRPAELTASVKAPPTPPSAA